MSVHAVFIEVFEMQTNDMAVEFFDTFQRIQAGTHPVTHISAGTHQRRTTFDGSQDRFGIPIDRMAFRMIMDGDLDIVFFAKFLNRIQGIGLRLGH